MSEETTKFEILEALNEFSTRMDQRFASIDQRFESIESTMVTKDYLDTRLAQTETRMVSKDYLDEKLWDLQGDMLRVIDRRVNKHEKQFHTS
jgi:hypothetical protein